MLDKPIYTEAIHAERIQKMLESDDPCDCCPASLNFNSRNSPSHPWAYDNDLIQPAPCVVCRAFVGARDNLCPCHKLGPEGAIKATWIALEEKGYY